jgi:hypothetical protein
MGNSKVKLSFVNKDAHALGPKNAQISDSRKALHAFAQTTYVTFFREGVTVKIQERTIQKFTLNQRPVRPFLFSSYHFPVQLHGKRHPRIQYGVDGP